MAESSESQADVIVVGAGFGGLGAALGLAESGARVVLCEALRYPGGCASTFQRHGHRFEAGATLFSGFDPDQPFARWIERHRMPVTVTTIDPTVELRTGAFSLAIPPDRDRMLAALAALPGVPEAPLRAFFAYQRQVADALWAVLDDPALLPPWSASMVLRHAARAGHYLPLLTCIGRPLRAVLDRFGLGACEPLRQFLDASLQITVQTSSAEAEAPFALSTLDYYFRGTRHVHGGIGALADAMVGAIRSLGGQVRFSDRVVEAQRDGSLWKVRTRKGSLRAPALVANVLPQALPGLLRRPSPRAEALGRKVEAGWGAVMLYLALPRDAPLRPEAHHLELVDHPEIPYIHGNHVFASISGVSEERGPEGRRTVTCSTHVDAAHLRALPEQERGVFLAGVQDAMRATLARRAPELWSSKVLEMTASPRTFERFTLRPGGLVGGVPRRAGLGQYTQLGPFEAEEQLWLVGDSVFPGQSTLATAIGGLRTAEAVLRSTGLRRERRSA
jgi:phytoene dehydrogenase-like protein